MKLPDFQAALLEWYRREKRDLPWRKTSDPYAIWVSEVMLQQTTVATVIPYWNRWMQRFPSVEELAQADPQELLGFWQGLGYYSRCRNLQKGAQHVVAKGLPQSVEEWRLVPGVGEYTAGAIASIAQSLPAPLVDGNVERVFSRIAANPAQGAELKKQAWIWAREVLVVDHPGDWNQALMELGATICTPKNPSCSACPVAEFCLAKARGIQDSLPTKGEKKKWKHLRHQAWLVCDGEGALVEQAPVGGWWEGLWQLPREEDTPEGTQRLAERTGATRLHPLVNLNHVVTNHKITLTLYATKGGIGEGQPWEVILALPLSAPQRKLIDQYRRGVRQQIPLWEQGTTPADEPRALP